MKTAEIKTLDSKYVLAYIGSYDSKIEDKTFYSIDISENDIYIQSICSRPSPYAPISIHLLKDKNTIDQTGIGTKYISEDKEQVLVIETAIEIILVYYDLAATKAQKVNIFKKYTADEC